LSPTVNYLDTSYLLKLYVQEQGSIEVAAWMHGRRDFVCSRHGRLEVISGLKRHQREQRIDARGLRQAMNQFADDESSGLIVWLSIDDRLLDQAYARVTSLSSSVFLRAADALHLACAADAGLKEIYSHDRHLLAAAPHFGLKGTDIISPKFK